MHEGVAEMYVRRYVFMYVSVQIYMYININIYIIHIHRQTAKATIRELNRLTIHIIDYIKYAVIFTLVVEHAAILISLF